MTQTYGLQAITTKYHGPTVHRGARVSARCGTGRLEVAWDYELDSWENHARAARAVIDKMGWGDRRWVGGWLPDGTVWVQAPATEEPL